MRLSCGWTQPADAVVLALGTPPPRHVASAETVGTVFSGGRYIADPWLPAALDGIDGDDRVLLLGTGLTMVDVAVSLARRHPRVQLVATSRHGLLPRVHASQPVPLGLGLASAPLTVRGLLAELRHQLAQVDASGHEWQGVIDGVREQIADLWRALPLAERERFLRHAARRLGGAPAPDGAVGPRRAVGPDRGRDAGGARRRRPRSDLFHPRGQLHRPAAGEHAGMERAGRRPARRRAGSPRPARPGFDVDDHGRLLRGDGSLVPWLSAVGFARRGTSYETTAVPELREQAQALAARVLKRHELPRQMSRLA